MSSKALAQLVRDAHRRITERRLDVLGAAFRERLARVMRVEGWLA